MFEAGWFSHVSTSAGLFLWLIQTMFFRSYYVVFRLAFALQIFIKPAGDVLQSLDAVHGCPGA